jgi:UDP-glucose 4-epimerase
MSWLVTGAAGYIGAHVVAALRAEGETVVALDDLSTGRPERLPRDVHLVRASVADRDEIAPLLNDQEIEGVIHLAARKSVEESVHDPIGYYSGNVAGLACLLDAVASSSARLFVFSSSAAVYGTPSGGRVDEGSPTRPESPYGETKLAGEWLVRAAARAHGLRWAALRYFNVVGAASPVLADAGTENLVPRVLTALAANRPVQVFGDDYPTRDGSCIRDYVGVEDIARAHVHAARALRAGHDVGALNLGRGEGATVLEVLDEIGAAAGRPVDYEIAGRRPGDPAEVVARVDRAERVLGWRADQDLADMVGSACRAFARGHPGALPNLGASAPRGSG